MLFTLHPADGHLNPMLGLSAALRERGHGVTFATSASFVGRVEARGERAVPVGLRWLESEGPVEPADPAIDPTGQATIFPRLFLREVAKRMASDLVDVVERCRPDVVVRESVEFAGAAVAERSGLPFATFDLTFPLDFHVMTTTGDIPDASELEALRHHVGLPEAHDQDWFLGDLVISTFPDRYRGARPLREPSVVIRPNALDVVDDATVPGWVCELDGAVYVSFGTVFPRFFPEAVSTAAVGASRAGRPTVVTYGPAADPDVMTLPRASHVRTVRYVPQGPVLDRSAVAVTHGGTGTTLGALARGVPLVVVPLGADQFGHARKVRELGAGIVLDHEDLTSQAVEDAVRAVLEDGAYADAAAELASEFAAMPPASAAVDALEALARAT